MLCSVSRTFAITIQYLQIHCIKVNLSEAGNWQVWGSFRYMMDYILRFILHFKGKFNEEELRYK